MSSKDHFAAALNATAKVNEGVKGLQRRQNTHDLVLRTLSERDLDAILYIEAGAYSHPWTRTNFLDSLSSQYPMQGLFAPCAETGEGSLVGYFVAMKGVDEVHLLNLTVAPDYQRRGYAKHLLNLLRKWAVHNELNWIWLEVRQSNTAAIALYTSYGFLKSGVRKNYYPLGIKGSHEREDALLMSYHITTCN
jgi:ribosomal-protein-alanine N-acetyltransferase